MPAKLKPRLPFPRFVINTVFLTHKHEYGCIVEAPLQGVSRGAAERVVGRRLSPDENETGWNPITNRRIDIWPVSFTTRSRFFFS